MGAEGRDPRSDQLADPAQPHYADGFAENLGARERRALPGVFAQRGVGRRDLAGRGQQQRQGVLGGAVNIRCRGVDHQHTALGGSVHIHVVQADPGPGDDLQLGGRRQHLGVNGGGRPHQQRVGFGHRGEQLLAVGPVHPAHLDLVSQGGDGRLGEFVGD